MFRKNIKLAKKLRKEQTEAEKKLWSVLRGRNLGGVKFKRQFSIADYILDFYAPEHKLGIEADGGQHYEDKGKERDKLRDRELSEHGIQMLRFNDLDILNNIEGVCKVILGAMGDKKIGSPSP